MLRQTADIVVGFDHMRLASFGSSRLDYVGVNSARNKQSVFDTKSLPASFCDQVHCILGRIDSLGWIAFASARRLT